jgi:hypothetical protein
MYCINCTAQLCTSYNFKYVHCTAMYSFVPKVYDFFHPETFYFLLNSKSVSISSLCDLINNSPGHRLIMTQQPFIITLSSWKDEDWECSEKPRGLCFSVYMSLIGYSTFPH